MGSRREFDDGWGTTLLASLLYPIGPAAIVLMPMIVGGLIDTYGFSEQEAANIAALEGMGLVVSSVLAALWIRRVSWTGALVAAWVGSSSRQPASPAFALSMAVAVAAVAGSARLARRWSRRCCDNWPPTPAAVSCPSASSAQTSLQRSGASSTSSDRATCCTSRRRASSAAAFTRCAWRSKAAVG